jgi:hypothetical protein
MAFMTAAIFYWQVERDKQLRDCNASGGFWTGGECVPARPDIRRV